MNAFQAVRERDKIKAIIYFTLTILLATVAGLITHFDALAHAAGLSVTDKGVSGILPLWVMTALRSLAVIGFLLASRLKNVSLRQFRLDWAQESVKTQELIQHESPSVAPPMDYNALASALVQAMEQAGAIEHITIEQQETTALPEPKAKEIPHPTKAELEGSTSEAESAEAKMMSVYDQIKQERANQPNTKPVSARELAKRANIRRSTCSEWLQKQDVVQQGEGDILEEIE